MTETEAALRMVELTVAAAKAVADFATFMHRDYPALASAMARGKALQRPMQEALAALDAFSAQWPDLPVPVMPDGPEKAAAMTLITPSTRH